MRPVRAPSDGRKITLAQRRSGALEHRFNGLGFEIIVFDGAAVTTGDGKKILTIPASGDGLSLGLVELGITVTASSSGKPTVQLHNITTGQDMLLTKVSVDVGEFSSETAATPVVIDPDNQKVSGGDRIRVDQDIAGTGTVGENLMLEFY